jgi:hypothetical protein
MFEKPIGRGAPPASLDTSTTARPAWPAAGGPSGAEAVATRRYGLPPEESASVVMRAKACPVLDAQRFKVGGSLDIKLFVEDPVSGTLTNPVMRIQHGLRRPIEGLIVTRQNIAGNVRTLLPGDTVPGDTDFEDFFHPPVGVPPPPHDPTREIILKASTVGLIIRALIF